MEPITISLIVLNIVSFILHGFHLKTNYKCGSSCCQIDGTIDEDLTKTQLDTDPKELTTIAKK